MQPYQYHVFVCTQEKPEGAPSCTACGSQKVLDRLRKEVGTQGLTDKVQVTACGSFGLCLWGPNMVVYPEGTWYSGVTPDDVPELVGEHFGNGKPLQRLMKTDAAEVRAEIEANTARRLGAMKAQDKAGVLPFEFQQRVRGFQESRIILTGIELDVFTQIGEGATVAQIAKKLGTDARATGMFLNALTSLELLKKDGDVYHNSPLTARYLIKGSPDDSRMALMHTVHLWTRWSMLTECVKAGTSVTYEDMDSRGEDWGRAFIAAMHKNATLRAGEVVAAIDISKVHKVLDVGGGSGAYSMAFVNAGKDIHAEVFDLPTIIPLTKDYVAKAGLSDRIGFKTGDMRNDQLGNGYDLVLLSAICHMFSEEENAELFGKCLRALGSRGQIVIQDFILNPDKTSPRTAALFALNMLVGTRRGNTYSDQEYFDALRGAGFENPTRIRLHGPTGLIIATKP